MRINWSSDVCSSDLRRDSTRRTVRTLGSLYGIDRLGPHDGRDAFSDLDQHRGQYLHHRRTGFDELLVHRHADAEFLALLDHRMAADRQFRPYPEAHVLGDIGAALFAALGVYFLFDPVADHLRIGIVSRSEGQ